MTTYGPTVPQSGPKPEAPPYGLLSVAQVIDDTDLHWVNGVTVWPYPPGPAQVEEICSVGGSPANLAPTDPLDVTAFKAFAVYLETHCTAASIGDFAEFKARLIASLDAVEGAQIEEAFAMGGFTGNPFPLDDNVTAPGGTSAVKAQVGLEVLEAAIAATGKQGVIHADPATVVAWSTLGNAVRVNGRRLETMGGTPIARGAGYIGVHGSLAAQDSASRKAWSFATGPVQVRLGIADVFQRAIADALDRDTNDVSVVAQRPVVADWDRELQAAVLIDRAL